MENQNKSSAEDYIIVPNPIYDVVFKYLMEDLESARIILSTLINKKITELNFEPLSHAEKIKDPKSEKDIKLFHLDFTATIVDEKGKEELIMIELQKANKASDVFRFKRYISKNFQKKTEKEIIHPITQAVEKVMKPIRLVPIFILNFRIENEINDLLIKTNRIKTGIFKEKKLEEDNEFIDNLSFDIYVVQLPNLAQIKPSDYEGNEYKTKLYKLLKLFDQAAQNPQNSHRLLLVKRIFPEFLERVINRLRSADRDNPDLESQMNTEDEYLAELIKRDNTISFIKLQLEKTSEKLEEKDRILEEKDKVLEENKKRLLELAKMLKENGFPMEVIIEKTNLSREEVDLL